MAYNNTIAIICNKASTINDIMSKLVLLRNLDKVVNSTPQMAIKHLKTKIPNTIIMHCEDDGDECLRLVRNLKIDADLRNIPILLLSNDSSREFFINAYEAGASEIIAGEISEHELLIRTIWALRRHEIVQKNEVKEKFLNRIGVIESETGFYSEQCGEDFLVSEINSVLKYKIDACLLLIHANKNTRYLSDVINQSIRIADSVAHSKDDNFYIFLPKTKLNGAYTVFERINANFRLEGGLRAGVIEIENNEFEMIKQLLFEALKKAKNGLASIITASDGTTVPTIKAAVPAGQKLKRLKSKSKLKAIKTGVEAEAKDIEVTNQEETEEERNSILFKQAFKKKSKVVIDPLFKKYTPMITEQCGKVITDKIIEEHKCELSITKGEVTSALIIRHGGFSKIEIDIVHAIRKEKKVKRTVMEITELDFEKLSKILTILIDEFKKNIEKAVYSAQI